RKCTGRGQEAGGRRGGGRPRRPADRGGADAGDRRHPGTPAQADTDLLTVGPPLVPARVEAPPRACPEWAGPTVDGETAPGLATWHRAGPVDGLRRRRACRSSSGE